MNAETGHSGWEDAVQWLRNQPDKRELVEAAYYDDPLLQAADRYYQSAEWSAVRALLPQAKGSALDIGAGRGIASYALARDGFAVTALEPDASSLVGAGAIRQLAEDAKLLICVNQQYSETLPFPDGTFDVVFARAALHHARDLRLTCSEIYRVLKPSGRLVAVREHVITKKSDLPAFLTAHPLHHRYGGENAFLLAEYLSAMRDAGFGSPTVLKPLLSPINYSPHNRETLREELCARLADKGIPAIASRTLLSLPFALNAALTALSFADHRPGRLYSFVADKR